MNHYQTLGVPSDATAEEIKAAFRSKAHSLHPDRNRGNRAAEAAFRAVTEAYEVLKDPSRRSAYDRQLGFGKAPAGRATPAPAANGGRGSALDAKVLSAQWARMEQVEKVETRRRALIAALSIGTCCAAATFAASNLVTGRLLLQLAVSAMIGLVLGLIGYREFMAGR